MSTARRVAADLAFWGGAHLIDIVLGQACRGDPVVLWPLREDSEMIFDPLWAKRIARAAIIDPKTD